MSEINAIREDGKYYTYYCPLRKNKKNNEWAVCLLCIAKQNPNFDNDSI
jgi:uncharacterized protein (UPF0305 family)